MPLSATSSSSPGGFAPLLQLADVAKAFVVGRNLVGRPTAWNHAVKAVDLDVARSETVGLVGESGAGKSTVGRLILRLIEPDRGTIAFDGAQVNSLSRADLAAYRSKVRLIFQDPFSSLDPSMIVGDSIAESLLIHRGLRRSERRAIVGELLDSVGMEQAHFDRFPYELSGGQLQRIAVAKAISTDPQLIVCDEAVAALDMSIRAQVINLLRDLQADRGLALLFISHDLSLVGHIADRVAVMYRGRVVETGRTEQIFTQPLHPYTRTLLAAIPMAHPSARQRERPVGPRLADAQLDLPGCDYADRCPSTVDICRRERPVLRDIDGSRVACHLSTGRTGPSVHAANDMNATHATDNTNQLSTEHQNSDNDASNEIDDWRQTEVAGPAQEGGRP